MRFCFCFARTLAIGVLLCLASQGRAGTLQTLDGRKFEGELRFADSGAVRVQPSEGAALTVPLTNVLRARFSSGPFLSGGSVLPNGWFLQDVGEIRGATRLDGDMFTIRAEGQGTNGSAVHFAGRSMHSDGEISARVDQVSGATGRAGLIMRARDSSVFVSLGCDASGRIWFDRRPDPARKEIYSIVVGEIPPPVWLRLYKRDQVVMPFVSRDGLNWQMVGRDKIKLTLEKTWREHEGELHLLRASFGVFGSSRGKGTVATGRVSQVSLTLNGLLAEYFADPELKNLAFARLDPQVRFDWRTSPPEGSMPGRGFSVRWTGTLVPPRTTMARFYFDGDDSARLWINDDEVPQFGVGKVQNGPVRLNPSTPMRLLARQPLKIKMELKDRTTPASAKLAWALSNDRMEVIGMTNFSFSFTATNSPEQLAPHGVNNSPPVHGVMLRDGTFLAGPISTADESAVKISFAGRKDVPVLNSRVARLVLRPPQQSLPYEVSVGRTGAFVKNGDFFESEFRGISHGALQMSSVLFGTKRFWIEGGDATVVVLNDCRPAANVCEVRLLDGSVLRAARISADAHAVAVEEPVLGLLTIPVTDVWEINRTSDSEILRP